MEFIFIGIIFITVAVVMATVLIYLAIIIAVFISGLTDGYLGFRKSISPNEYKCKNEFRKWINALRYVRYILGEIIVQWSYDLGYFIGKFCDINLGKVTIFKRAKTFLIYSKKDTCKETK